MSDGNAAIDWNSWSSEGSAGSTSYTSVLSQIRRGSQETEETLSSPASPEWLPDAILRIFELTQLQEDWNSYGGREISVGSVRAALRLIEEMVTEDTPEPSIVPTSSGHIQLEWHTRGIDLEIEAESDTKYSYLFEDLDTGEEHEGDASYDLTELASFIDLLAHRA